MKLLVLNGPNLNFIGIREPNIYGKETYSDLCNFLNECVKDKNVALEIKQSNHEGELVDFIQQAYYDKVDGIIINPGAYTHTSIALLDAVKSVNIKTIEVHLSDVTKREDFRQVSYIRMACVKSIMGKGFLGYKEAIEYFLNN
jgi:3-dehydroquinate dehydratase-2